MAKTTLSRAQFASLFLRILKRAYPSVSEFSEVRHLPFNKLIGYNEVTLPENSINKKMTREYCGLGNQTLAILLRQYDNGSDLIMIRTEDKRKCEQYVGAGLEELQLIQLSKKYAYDQNNYPPKHFFNPDKYRHQHLKKNKKNNELTEGYESNVTNENIARDKWWFYTYESGFGDNGLKIKKRVLVFELIEGVYKAQLQTIKSSRNLKGTASITDSLLILELSLFQKIKMFFMANIDPIGDKDIYLGQALRHDEKNEILRYAVILERIPKEIQTPKPEIIEVPNLLSKNIKGEIDPRIAYFFEKKNFVSSKSPNSINIFSKEELEQWLEKKKKSRGEIQDIDIFISTPYSAVRNYEALIESAANEFDDDTANLIKQKLLDQSFYDNYNNNEHFLNHIQSLQEKIENHYQIHTYFAYSKEQLTLEETHMRSPIDTLTYDYEFLMRSRVFILICTYSFVFSSCWIILGWAMRMAEERNIKIFILYSGGIERVLPFLLHDAQNWKNKLRLIKIIKGTRDSNLAKDLFDVLRNDSTWKEIFGG